MNSAEFKTTRQILGISALQFATYLQTDCRAIQRMESGKTDPKGFAIDVLVRLYLFYRMQVKKECQYIDRFLVSKSETVTLIRYKKGDFSLFNPEYKTFPDEIGSTVLARVKEYVESKNFDLRIVYFQPTDYLEWLSGRQDTKDLRMLWASTLLDKNQLKGVSL